MATLFFKIDLKELKMYLKRKYRIKKIIVFLKFS